jgi:hypothetical protein
MSYHFTEITWKYETVRIKGFEERNPYLYGQSEQIVEFEITIKQVKRFQTTTSMLCYDGSPNGGKYHIINELIFEIIDSDYKLEKNVDKFLPPSKTLHYRHFVIHSQDTIVDVLSENEPTIEFLD